MKIICIVQARMGSERLPGKVMKEILGEPMITYTLDRAAKSKYIDKVILATSDQKTEEPFVKYLEEHNYEVFRGSENNVLKRYIDAIEKFGGDIIIRATGDCPFLDPIMIDYVITYYLNHNYDYVSLDIPETYFRGFDIEVFSKKSIEKVNNIVNSIEKNSSYKEHVTLYMYRHPEEFSVYRLKASSLYKKPYRLCVDTKEDFQLVTTIYKHFNNKYVSAKEVVKYLDEHPEIIKINQDISQKEV